MKVTKRIPVWETGEYNYQGAGAFIPHLCTYLHEDEMERPAMIVCPGGGYFFVAPLEGELVAKKFYEKGYNCFVFTYTTNPTGCFPLMDQPLKDISRAIRYVRAHAAEYHIAADRVYICGFSAAGHLCASICNYHADVKEENPAYQNVSNRPDAAILSYPVISSGPKAHQGSFQFLLDMEIYERTDAEAAALLDHYSLDKHVSEQNPPVFLWATITDDLVPVENSFLYEAALREKGIFHAMHLFSHGPHGLSIADEDWASRKSEEIYTLDEFVKIREALQDGSMKLSPKKKEELLEAAERMFEKEQPGEVWPEVMAWPDLADAFLKELESK